jgi:hypothetical protein
MKEIIKWIGRSSEKEHLIGEKEISPKLLKCRKTFRSWFMRK